MGKNLFIKSYSETNTWKVIVVSAYTKRLFNVLLNIMPYGTRKTARKQNQKASRRDKITKVKAEIKTRKTIEKSQELKLVPLEHLQN